MLSDKVHLLIKSLNAGHVGFCVIRKFYFLSVADAFGSPVELSHIYWASDLACYGVETGLPSLDRLACALWCKCKVHDRCLFHFVDYAESDIASSFSVNRNTSHLAENPSERSPEQFTLDHAVWLASYGSIIKV